MVRAEPVVKRKESRERALGLTVRWPVCPGHLFNDNRIYDSLMLFTVRNAIAHKSRATTLGRRDDGNARLLLFPFLFVTIACSVMIDSISIEPIRIVDNCERYAVNAGRLRIIGMAIVDQ